ncbi:MAG TPA: hypothetical protein PLK94_13180 [Alphaproteobacteria bacterium]|nr:hypothetical protein [Alphaproteobacteria bacterium]HPQ45010.1 hypothetical protein [Syntrophales bacterium]
MNQIISTLIGGMLAASTGWLLQTRSEHARIKRLKQLLLIGITDDLKLSIELYGRVIDEWEKSKTVWYTTISELRESRQIYVKNRDWMALIDDEILRQGIFKYYNMSSNYISVLENQQKRKYEILAKLNELIREIQLRNGDLSIEQAQQKAIQLMPAEGNELNGLNTLLPQIIQHMRDFRSEAKELLIKLNSNK